VQPVRCTRAWCKHWPNVSRNSCSRTCQLRLDRSVWQSQNSGCLKGTSGLVLLGSSDPERRQRIEERMQGFGGTVFESNLPPELQEEIESEIERQKAAQRATAPGR
jgi:hypothetical protein